MDTRSILAQLRSTENAYHSTLLAESNRSERLNGAMGGYDGEDERQMPAVDVDGPKAAYDTAIALLRNHLIAANATRAITALDTYLTTNGGPQATKAYQHLIDALGI